MGIPNWLRRGGLAAAGLLIVTAVDYALHLLHARETVSRDYAGQPGDVRALLDGYAAGLNRYAGQRGLAMPGVPATNFLSADAAGISRASWAARWFADLLAVEPRGNRVLARAHAVLAPWDWSYDGKGPADALAALLLRTGNRWHYPRKDRVDPRAALLEAATYLQTHFGRIDPVLGDVLRLRQSKVDLPLDGGPDVLRAAANWDEAADGRLVVKHGDSFIMFMHWNKAGQVRSESIQPYGAATTRPASKHYADQAAMFARHQLKPVWFSAAQLAGHFEKSYRP